MVLATHLILDQKTRLRSQGHKVQTSSWRQTSGRCEFALYRVTDVYRPNDYVMRCRSSVGGGGALEMLFVLYIVLYCVLGVMLRSEFLVEASRLCQMDDNNVTRVLAITDEPPRVVLEHGDATKDLKTFLRHRSSHSFSSTDSPTRLTSSPSRSATAALRSPVRLSRTWDYLVV